MLPLKLKIPDISDTHSKIGVNDKVRDYKYENMSKV
jgi:hypothetical protein